MAVSVTAATNYLKWGVLRCTLNVYTKACIGAICLDKVL